jgi:rSAM/selenodomain-associated transferase 2
MNDLLNAVKISVVIPTLNEAKNIVAILDTLSISNIVKEIIIVDSPDSNDNIERLISKYEVCYLRSKTTSRAAQFNLGAQFASSEILYFVHADVELPKNFEEEIVKSISNGADLGCFRLKFNSSLWLLKLNAFFTRFSFLWCRGGDQTLFIKKNAFETLGKFNEDFIIMEEYDLIRRSRGLFKFKIMESAILVSARKYEKNNYFKVQYVNFKAMRMFLSGKYRAQEIKNYYQKHLNLNY